MKMVRIYKKKYFFWIYFEILENILKNKIKIWL
jgi:hypothetical protein